jgi:hypothetical protein
MNNNELSNPSQMSSHAKMNITNNNELTNSSEMSPVVFDSDFNHFEKLNATQAWSLYLTGGKEDKVLGTSPLIGRLLNFSLIALAGISWILVFKPF